MVQFAIYKEIRARFSDHIWLDIVSKCDLLRESPVIFVTEDGKADDSELARYRKMGPDGALHVSVKNEVGLDDVSTLFPLHTFQQLLLYNICRHKWAFS